MTTPSIHDTAFRRALSMLNTVGAQYAVVYNGQTYGALELAPALKPRRRGPGIYPRGMTRAHYLPYLEALPPGGTACIPYNGFDKDVLQSHVSAYCAAHWGKGGYMANRREDVQELHVLRFAPIDEVPA